MRKVNLPLNLRLTLTLKNLELSLVLPMLLAAALLAFSLGVASAAVQAPASPEIRTNPVTGDSQDNPENLPIFADDKYYTSFFARSWEIPAEISLGNTFWIEVDLSEQTLMAYRGSQIINSFVVSTGTRSYPTVTGTYKIYSKYNKYNMRGPGYDLSDVPYAMFFHQGYSIHGTYWHDNFGTPMSRGCVNMKTNEAAWLFENAPVGTYVFVHY